MGSDDMASQFAAMPPGRQKLMLARLCWELTLLVRDVLTRSEIAAEQKVKHFFAVNEAVHRLSDHLLKLLASQPERYPDDVLVQIVQEHFDSGGLSDGFRDAWARAVKSVDRLAGDLGR